MKVRVELTKTEDRDVWGIFHEKIRYRAEEISKLSRNKS